MVSLRPGPCPTCASPVAASDRFCSQCGTRLPLPDPALSEPPPTAGSPGATPVPSASGPTPEQLQVVHHPQGRHARVMAVAGSGKTTTMVSRIEHLVLDQGVRPQAILVLMYNALARIDFKRKLRASAIPEKSLPYQVHTFHSYAFGFLNKMAKEGLVPRFDLWSDDKQYLVDMTLLEALRGLRLAGEVDPDEAGQAIGLWKGSLIPPERAGYRGHPRMPEVYRAFERLRAQKRGLTFDDFVPAAVGLLETDEDVAGRWCNQADFVIVDEYQDANYGQHRLLELVAGSRADVMVVGDDDQTIYEWRGARPNYIIREFQQAFADKPHVDYRLSRSFRFGPLLAQSAQNAIAFNSNRVPKRLVAHDLAQSSQVAVVTDQSNQAVDVDKELADQVQHLLEQEGVAPNEVAVLARMFVQLSGLETQFLARKIPYHVLGAAPFFERKEVRALLDYVRVAHELDEPMDPGRQERFLGIANTPGRMLTRATLQGACQRAQGHLSTQEVLRELADPGESPFTKNQREQVDGLLMLLLRIRERVVEQPELTAGGLLEWIAKTVNYAAHFDDYYGEGESAADRKFAVASLIAYATQTGLGPLAFLDHVARQDPTQGAPKDRQVMMTTIFKTKGLEYDYVVMPHCEEGYLPCLFGSDVAVFDTAGIVKEPEPSESIENERRLFYVGLTRARKACLIGASTRPTMGYLQKDATPSRFLEEMQLDSVVGILAPLQRLVAGNPAGHADLVAGVRRHAGRRWVKLGLVENYLGGLGDDRLVGEVAALVGRASEEPFAYARAYEAARASARRGGGRSDARRRPVPPRVAPNGPIVTVTEEPVPPAGNGLSKRPLFAFLRRDA